MESPTERWAELALHPARIRILRAVAGARHTPRELVALLPDIPQATLYRHLAMLVKGGILDVVEERKVRGTVERVYALPAHGATLDPATLASATPEDHARYFTAFVSGLLSDFSRYLARDHIDLAADGAGYQQIVLHLTDAELARFANDLTEVLRPLLANQPDQGRVPRLLATILLPVDQPSTSNDTSEDSPGPTDDPGTTEGNDSWHR
ncbi:helix-turn-helix domain-containing protein [Micromonospora polyrhachis]|uniref:DNA-binding transcriptional ArsR family regulator n=1 Tax=Micromonospora polyrhachis TaxID=1282883 RepID=A0A7W7SW97_9ACTN|nr:helix-turn-helix domain-containing protein [Micromonospora polyrhachis]MBB4962109.1 DNA-binding transcriptional ArsR family regulator [Micromonospora polyrhachis]